MTDDSALFTDDPAPTSRADASLFTDEPAPSSLLARGARGAVDLGKRVGQGAVSDLTDIRNMTNRTLEGVADLPADVADTARTVAGGGNFSETPIAADFETIRKGVTAVPGAVTQQAQEVGAQPLKMIPGTVGEEMKKAYPGNPFVEHPLNTAALLAPLAEPALGAVGKSEAAAPAAVEPPSLLKEPAPKPDISPPSGEAVKPPSVEPPPPVAAAPAAPAAPAPVPLTEHLAGQAVKAADDVKDYISRGYEGFAKKPGMTNNIADYVQGKSQMMALQQMGFTPGQGRNLGKTALEVHNAERAIGQYGLDSGIVGPGSGLDGMVKKNHALLESVGNTIGDIREAADKAGPAYAPGELFQAVKAKLDPIYQKGVTAEHPAPVGLRAPDNAAYQRALDELKEVSSHSDAADAATAINREATLSTKMTQNPGPYTDVANAVSEINNERLKAKLTPEAAAQYEHALREFGVNKKIQNALKYKTSGEVKRFGPGSMVNNMTQKAMDEVGYRVGAKALNKLSTSILKDGSVAHSLPSLFKTFINHVEEVGHEISGMAQGGLVTKDMADFVGGRR